ncbi:MAG: glycosyltransferase family 2 protein [Actinobacteria bacterium]|nr:MAG: glycosyltransferase family 2 protein [Actinomycetota bacterium]
MELVSVIIPNWNGKSLLNECLASVYNQTYPNIEIIVVDNGSTDGSREYLESRVERVKSSEGWHNVGAQRAVPLLILNNKNEGFAKAVNQGIKQSKGTFVMPLNNDIVLEKTFIEEMVKAAKKDSKIGTVSGKLIRNDKYGQIVIDCTGHVIFKNRLLTNRGFNELDKGQYDKEEYVFGASGAAPLYRRLMLNDIAVDGQFYDESFFSFLEDVDLDWRAQLRGWSVYYTPLAVAFHHRGGSAVRRSKIVEMHNFKNRYLLMIKNDNAKSVAKNLPGILFSDLVKSGALLFRCPKALLGIADVIKLLPQTLKKRKVIQQNKVVSLDDMEKWFRPFSYRSWFKRHIREDVYKLRDEG